MSIMTGFEKQSIGTDPIEAGGHAKSTKILRGEQAIQTIQFQDAATMMSHSRASFKGSNDDLSMIDERSRGKSDKYLPKRKKTLQKQSPLLKRPTFVVPTGSALKGVL